MKQDDSIVNILIVGTGGQGVITLSSMLRNMYVNEGYKCEGASFKGGAQRMGSVYTELRALKPGGINEVFTSQIRQGEVDILIGMEPWESLRYANRCSLNTKIIVNSHEEKLFVERYQSTPMLNPVLELEKIFDLPIIKDYTKLTGEGEHMNTIMLKDAILEGILPFNLESLHALKLKSNG